MLPNCFWLASLVRFTLSDNSPRNYAKKMGNFDKFSPRTVPTMEFWVDFGWFGLGCFFLSRPLSQAKSPLLCRHKLQQQRSKIGFLFLWHLTIFSTRWKEIFDLFFGCPRYPLGSIRTPPWQVGRGSRPSPVVKTGGGGAPHQIP